MLTADSHRKVPTGLQPNLGTVVVDKTCGERPLSANRVGPLGGPFEPDSDLRTVIEAWNNMSPAARKQIARIATTGETPFLK